ncbi:MAG: LysR family transcriptional regulator [Gammaproteobacteria bacterium]|nr:LysR family transcriptional regulator [Gammaproteobacteria bacterium]
MQYTLRQLEVFLATAKWENITRAAAELSMSQSAASSALGDLERQFALRFFDRVGKRLQLNDFGRSLRAPAQALLEQAQELERAMRQQSASGCLKVGAALTIGNYLAVGIMARFIAEQQGARVQLEVANSSTIADRVARFELDIGMVEGEVRHPELVSLPWHDDELVAFCAPGHPFTGKKALSDADLLQARWIVRETGSSTRKTFEQGMGELLPRMQLLLELQHTEAIKRAVEAELGLGCLSALTLREAFARGSLLPLAIPQRRMTRRLYLILHRQKYRSAAIRRWIELSQEALPRAMATKSTS